jgi:hypothetical protein
MASQLQAGKPEGGAGSTFGTDYTKQISRLGPLIVGGMGA